MIEVSKLTERLDNLIEATSKIGPNLERSVERHAIDVKDRIVEMKSDSKESRDKIISIEKSMSFVKGAMWVFGGLFAIFLVVLGIILKSAFKI